MYDQKFSLCVEMNDKKQSLWGFTYVCDKQILNAIEFEIEVKMQLNLIQC